MLTCCRALCFFKASDSKFCISFAQINLKIQNHLYTLRAAPKPQSASVCAHLIFQLKTFLYHTFQKSISANIVKKYIQICKQRGTCLQMHAHEPIGHFFGIFVCMCNCAVCACIFIVTLYCLHVSFLSTES